MDDCRRSHPRHDEPTNEARLATWVDRAMAEMKSEVGIICNAWLKTGYEWFPKEGSEQEVNIIGGEEGSA